jgi:undecaprenyl-diphosphatase
MIKSVVDFKSAGSFQGYLMQIKLPLGIVIGTIPAGLVGFIFEDWITENLHYSYYVAFALIVIGVVMWYFDGKSAESDVDSIEKLSLKDYFIIGLWQVIALFPGASRSGSTITGARSLKIERETAAEVSFLLGLPLVLGAGLKGFYDLVKQSSQANVVQVDPGVLLVGFVVAFISAMLVIKFLLSFLQKQGLKVFAIYRLLLGLGLIVYFVIH